MGALVQIKTKEGKFIQIKATLIVNEGDYIKVYQGKCDCYKNTCGCVKERVFHRTCVTGVLDIK